MIFFFDDSIVQNHLFTATYRHAEKLKLQNPLCYGGFEKRVFLRLKVPFRIFVRRIRIRVTFN